MNRYIRNFVSLCFVLSIVASRSQAQNIFVVSPNTFRLSVPETVSIFVAPDNSRNVHTIRVSLRDYPGGKNEFSISEVNVPPGEEKVVTVKVTPKDVPDLGFYGANSKLRYVTLLVSGPNFKKESNILVSSEGGYYFLQTAKPIYKPKERVSIRIIPLNENLRPSSEPFKLAIINPQDRIVEEVPSSDLKAQSVMNKPFYSFIFKIPSYPLFGEWKVAVRYGHNFHLNTTVAFTVKEYVLPTFTVKVRSPSVILEDDIEVSGHLVAVHTYGKKVQGNAVFRFGVKNEAGNTVYVGKSQNKELDNGRARYTLPTDYFKNDTRIGWFPKIAGNHFVVEGTVVEWATGKREVTRDESTLFATSPYALSFKNCVKHYKAGLKTLVSIDASYISNKRPVKNLPIQIEVTDQHNRPVKVLHPEQKTDKNGQVDFEVMTARNHESLTVKAVTFDIDYPRKNQATGSVNLHSYIFPVKGIYVSIAKTKRTQILEIGKPFTEIVSSNLPHTDTDVYFVILGRGTILKFGQLLRGDFVDRVLSFHVTPEMVPMIRVVVFAVHNRKLVADSVVLNVENRCSPEAEVYITPRFQEGGVENPKPGSEGEVQVKGSSGTFVGILAVDEAVYALKDNDKLTRERLFKAMFQHDLGCGPGGGLNTEEILASSGIVILSNVHSDNSRERKAFGCEEKLRRKREIVESIVEQPHYTLRQRACCKLGLYDDLEHRSCQERADIIQSFYKHEHEDEEDESKEEEEDDGCAAAFLQCCTIKWQRDQSNSRARTLGGVDHLQVDLGDIMPESEEGSIMTRSDFREVFLFDDVFIGALNHTELRATLPHSITTWVFQAFGLSAEHGMCVAEPKEVVAFQKLFLQVDLPYSVVRNEQIEIPATVYNYGSDPIGVSVYIYGVKGICSEAKHDEKSERKRARINGNSALTMTFPVVPLETGEFKIRVVALSFEGGDAVEKILRVVPEGRVVEKDISIALDPTNQQKRKRSVKTDLYSDSIDETNRLQLSVIEFPTDNTVVPGTENCAFSIVGDSLGPVVQTTINDLDKLLNVPRGCGEQTMMFMAPTLYTLAYLKATGRMTDETEKKAYDLVRQGYQRELTFRKPDGSFAAWVGRATSTWLTAFVMKAFCQASRYIYVDPEVIRSGLTWLARNQNADGSFIDRNPIIHRDMMGGLSASGTVPMTAFVSVTFQECASEMQNVALAAERASTFLQLKLDTLANPYDVALVAYALSLTNRELGELANEKLKRLSTYNPDQNTRYWVDSSKSRAIETSSYALLTQLTLGDMDYAIGIVNWLNTQRTFKGGFPSTQDTSIGLQALSEYAAQSQFQDIDFVCNATVSTDAKLSKTFAFQNDNSHILQEYEIGKVGGHLIFKTAGKGVGMLNVKYRYHVLDKEDICKFDITVNVSEVKEQVKARSEENFGKDFFEGLDLPDGLINQLGIRFGDAQVAQFPEESDPQDHNKLEEQDGNENNLDEQNEDLPRKRIARNVDGSRERFGGSKLVWKLNICVKYLSDSDSDMGIIDVGMFTGFSANKDDIGKLVEREDLPISRYELSGKNVVFYLESISHKKPVCFSFRIVQDFVVQNTQAATVKAYDYYKPDEVCTEFYSPSQTSPVIRTICKGQVCECAEGGCPSPTAFQAISQLAAIDRGQAENVMFLQACSNFSFVWLVTPASNEVKNGFRYITFNVKRVIKEGIERREEIENEQRQFMARENCPVANLEVDEQQRYIIMGQDGNTYEDSKTRKKWYRYMLDKNVAIHKWYKSPRDGADPQLQKVFHSLQKLAKRGCND